MRLLNPAQAATLRGWLLPDSPSELLGLHVLQTGHGACFVDRWPDPRAALFESRHNGMMVGDPTAFQPSDLERLQGLVQANQAFVPVLVETFPELLAWNRVVLVLPSAQRTTSPRRFAP
ncbi:MAG: hypothetical protein U0821_25755 [Chloroflexota bacterium]